MLYWALIFFIVAILAAVLGFGGVATAAAGIAKILFFLFLVLFIINLIFGLLASRAPRLLAKDDRAKPGGAAAGGRVRRAAGACDHHLCAQPERRTARPVRDLMDGRRAVRGDPAAPPRAASRGGHRRLRSARAAGAVSRPGLARALPAVLGPLRRRRPRRVPALLGARHRPLSQPLPRPRPRRSDAAPWRPRMSSIASARRRGRPSVSNSVGRSAAPASASRSAPMPIRRNRVAPSASPASSRSPVRNSASASWVGAASRRERVRMRKSAVFSLSVTVPAASPPCFRRAATFSQSGQSRRPSAPASLSSRAKVVSAEIE